MRVTGPSDRLTEAISLGHLHYFAGGKGGGKCAKSVVHFDQALLIGVGHGFQPAVDL